MSIQGRATNDYSPLRGPINDQHGKDVSGRTKHERQQYEAAVNARREMLEVIATQPRKKFSKKDRERLSLTRVPLLMEKGESLESFSTRQSNANAKMRHVLRQH